jgi:hypothetical protein
MPSKDHWERVCTAKPATVVGWYQDHAARAVREFIDCHGRLAAS